MSVLYKFFNIGSLFTVKNGKRVTKDSQIKGNIPYVTAATENNGIDSYIGNPPFVDNNILTVNFFGNTYYHPYDVSYKDGTYGLKLINDNHRKKPIYLYMKAVIEKTALNLGSYSKMLTGNILHDTSIELPVKSITDTEPDWEYMEQYIKEIEKKAILKVKEQNEKNIALLKEIVGQEKGSDFTEDVEFREFKFGDFFNIEKTSSFNKASLTPYSDGNMYPYITRTSENNGILGYTGIVKKGNINPANTFSLGLLQMDFFFQKEPWYAGQFVRCIKPKLSMTMQQMLYFKVVFTKFKSVLLSGLVREVDYKFLNAKVFLPVNKRVSEQVPDWKSIEEYMKHIQQKYINLKEQENEIEINNLLSVTGLTPELILSEEGNLPLTLISWDFINYQMAKIELDLKLQLAEKLTVLAA